VDLEQQIADVFIQRLSAQSNELLKQLNPSNSESSSSVLVRSHFELPIEQQSAIETAIKEIIERDSVVRFETSPTFLCGIELIIGGYKIGWSIDDYMHRMESSMSELLQQSSLANSPTTNNAKTST
jgi:F-type H+-transporting ATPase subunit b